MVNGNVSPRLDAAKSNSNLIYTELRKDLDLKFNNEHLAYILERVKKLKWAFDFSDDLIIYIANESLKGRRSEGIANDVLKSFSDITLANAKTLASTVSSIQSTQITRLRAEDVGLNWYQWRSSGDGRVRNSHKKMEGVLVKWSDPPSPEMLVGEESIGHYHAGECNGCRCYAAPLVNIKFIKKLPLKVYLNGKITRMSKTRFKELCLQ